MQVYILGVMRMFGLDKIIETALQEDIHTGDLTTQAVVPKSRAISARLVAKESMILCGLDVAARVFHYLDPSITFTPQYDEGSLVTTGSTIAVIEGEAALLLQGERVALNLMQRMCGIATMTSQYVKTVKGTKARVVDTRKTTPGLRQLEKYAVRIGGGNNHRTGLYDGVLIKENHITAAGGISVAIRRARDYIPHTLKIEIETETLDQVKEALDSGADIIMLDNMDNETMKQAVSLIAGKALVEASGGVNLDTIRGIAETGVDLISVGALTHSARAMDISMLMEDI
jgi:nicotinate-nucleotide pyrophosphorylase (carboxylating)